MTLWFRLIRDLRRRGGGYRESGAFLLGTRADGGDLVKAYACYDDLDPHALDTGTVALRGSGFAALWARCRELGIEVLADVHTHPDDHPVQSGTDRVNPMISEVGHVALILPRYAGTWGLWFRDVAIYEYAGNYTWKDWAGPRRRQRVRFCWR
jgi:proteasome lid subunit RPN8/RPN11